MGKKIGFAAGQEHDFELALLALGKHGTGVAPGAFSQGSTRKGESLRK